MDAKRVLSEVKTCGVFSHIQWLKIGPTEVPQRQKQNRKHQDAWKTGC
jgi:hypothetical protein